MTTTHISIRCNRCGAFRYYAVVDDLESLLNCIEWLQDEMFCDECLNPYDKSEQVTFEEK